MNSWNIYVQCNQLYDDGDVIRMLIIKHNLFQWVNCFGSWSFDLWGTCHPKILLVLQPHVTKDIRQEIKLSSSRICSFGVWNTCWDVISIVWCVEIKISANLWNSLFSPNCKSSQGASSIEYGEWGSTLHSNSYDFSVLGFLGVSASYMLLSEYQFWSSADLNILVSYFWLSVSAHFWDMSWVFITVCRYSGVI